MQIMRPEDAAAMLGMHYQTLLYQAKAGIIPAYKPKGRWYFFKEELEEYIKSGHNRTVRDGAVDRSKSWLQHPSNLRNVEKHGITCSQPQTEKEYANLLKLGAKNKRKN